MVSPPNMIGQQMSEIDIRKFLRKCDFGVLSLAHGNQGYGLPISYSYDQANNRLILGFVANRSGKKGAFITASEEVTLTIYQFDDVDIWQSVIVTGSLHLLEDSDVPEDLLPIYFKLIDNPAKGKKWTNTAEIGRNLHELRITDITGLFSGQIPSYS